MGEIIELMRNGTSENQVNFPTNFPVTRIETISKGVINYNKVGFVENIDESYRLHKGDILLSNINSLKYIGNLVIYEEDKTLYHGMNLMLIRFKQNYDKKYLYYFMKYKQHWFQKMACQAVNQASINQSSLKKFPIYIPPNISEQNKISNFLTFIDLKIQLLEQKYQTYFDFKKYLMQQIFTQKLRFDFNEKWKVYKLKDLLSVKSSNISINKVDNNTGDYPLYGTGGYLQNIDFYEMEDEYISITKDGSVGKIDYHEGKSSIINTSQYLIPNKNFNIRFLYYQLQTLNFEKYIVGSSIPHIYFKDYGNEKVKIPNLLEQEIIAKLFIVIDKKLYMLDKSISLMYRFKKGLLQQMFI